jgi:2-dehydropantoate 2-reductase
MRFVVIGAGGVGGVVGGRLAQHGHDVALVARGEHLEAIAERGLRLQSPDEDITVEVPALGHVHDVVWRDGDVAVLAVKGQDTAAALADLASVADPATPVACLQNGVDNERAALRLFERVYGVCVMLPATFLEPGVVQASSSPVTGILDLGRYPTGVDATAEAMAAALRASSFSSEAVPDVMRWKHAKLLMNLGNAAEALLGQGEGAEIVGLARREGIEVMRAAGIDVATRDEDVARRGDLLTMRPIGGAPRGGGSTWQSIVRGTGSVEADLLNGEIVLLGRLHGVPTPVNELLRQMAKDLARRGGAPGEVTERDLLDRLAQASPDTGPRVGTR